MTAKRKPRCFVAMAFDHDDTDALYEKAIEPVLESNGVMPVIINRRQDNRDINHQIIDQLDACDFCITDLTYTRPSVYFEAGYAQRAVEVIYTVRSDHLGTNQPDDLRVHFDLQMKPLIKWATPEDSTFPSRLKKRLRSTVLKTWHAAQKKNEKTEHERATFGHMALSDRLFALRKEAVSKLGKLGFGDWSPLDVPHRQSGMLSVRQIVPRLGVFPWVISQRRDKRQLHVVSVWIDESVTLRLLRDDFRYRFISSSYPPHLDGHKMVEERTPVNQTVEHHVIVTLRSVPQSRIMSAMPSLHWDPTHARYVQETEWSYSGQRWSTKGKRRDWVDVNLFASRTIYVHFLDGIKSVSEFKSGLAQVVDEMEEQPTKESTVPSEARGRASLVP